MRGVVIIYMPRKQKYVRLAQRSEFLRMRRRWNEAYRLLWRADMPVEIIYLIIGRSWNTQTWFNMFYNIYGYYEGADDLDS